MKVCLACEQGFAARDWRCPRCGAEPAFVDGVPLFAPDAMRAGVGFDPRAFAVLADLEAESFWFRARNRLIVETLRRHFPAARSLLEVGCGTGFVLQGLRAAFPDLTIAGSELFIEALGVAQERVRDADFYQLDACRLPFSAEWDLVGVRCAGAHRTRHRGTDEHQPEPL